MTAPEPTVAINQADVAADRCTTPTAGGADLPGPALSEVLKRLGCTAVSRDYDSWTCRLPGRRGRASIALTERWLSISRSLRVARKPMAARSLLSRNARLGEGAGLSIAAGQGRLLVECPADVMPWEHECDFDALFANLLVALGAAPPGAARQPEMVLSRDVLEELFTEAGWPVSRDGKGPLEVPLDVAGHYLTAELVTGPQGVCLRLPLLVAEFDAAATECRAAAMQFFWLAVTAVRWVRPGLRGGQLMLEVHIPGRLAQAPALAHACAALSVAASGFIEEASLLLAHRELARLYLSQSDFKGVS